MYAIDRFLYDSFIQINHEKYLTGNTTRTIVYGVIYLVIRIIYAFMYILGLQPWRTMIFTMGLACTLAISLDLVITMSRRPN